MIYLPTQYKLCVLQGLIVEQPVQFCPLCRGVAVLVLHGDAVDGKGSAIGEPGFYPVGVHVVAAGKQFHHSSMVNGAISLVAAFALALIGTLVFYKEENAA